jgi:hypothetical protein
VTPEHEPSPHCLDAETMAAWVDRALPSAEAAAADAHVADCARCQAVLAVLVKALPAVAQPVPWWRRRWALGTLVPIAGGALALAVWIATPRSLQAPASPLERTSTTAPAVASTPPPTIASAPQAAAPSATAEPPRAQAGALSERIELAPPAPPPSRTNVASPPATAEARDEPARAKTDQLRRADAAPAAAPVAPAAARQAVAARALESTLNKTAVGVEIVSPDPSIRWRIGAAGSIQRSADGGATWAAQPSGVAQDLTAGTSPQRGVCWVVGRAGTVLVLTNGNLWRRLEFPEIVDITQVDARDGLVASVTVSDGRRFQTTDGGQTWARPQDF